VILLLSLPPAKKNFLLIFSIPGIVVFGRRNIDVWYIVVLDKLDLIRIDLPPIDKELPCYTSNFFSIFSSNFFQSTACNLPEEIGTPRYLTRKIPI
jgi:hypothetical protein